MARVMADVLYARLYAIGEDGADVLVASYPVHLDESADEIARAMGNTDLDPEADVQLLHELAPEGELKDFTKRMIDLIGEGQPAGYKTGVCATCAAPIELRPVSKASEDFRWYASSNVNSWHCGSDPAYPVRTHAPAVVEREADRKHEFESERGEEFGIDKPCAVCGLPPLAKIHGIG